MKRRIFKIIFYDVILLLSAFLLLSSICYRKLYNGTDVEQIMFHARANLTGADNSVSIVFSLGALLPAFIFSVLMIPFLICFTRHNFKKKMVKIVINIIIPVCLITASCFSMVNVMNIPQFIKYNNEKSTFIEENYISFADDDITFPSQKRNLIYIQVESLEKTLHSTKNGGIFTKEVIPEILKLENENITFSNNYEDGEMYSVSGTTWTSASMVATSSGLPIKGVVVDYKNNRYLHDTKTIWDILSNNGYENYCICGCNADFAGNRIFYKEHGNTNIFDYEKAKETGKIPKDYKVFWGYEDKKLYDYSKEIITNAYNDDKPFSVRIVTVDTHFPDGNRCCLCKNEFAEQYLNCFACASRQVYNFIEWAKTQEFYKNTTIVIAGDHPFMSTYMDKYLPENYTRTLSCIFINVPENIYEEKVKREYCSFDLFPTMLASIGCNIKSNKLALGTNLFSDEKTIIEKFGYEYVNQELKKSSDFYNSLTGQS